jgi:hypothetical protein
MFYPVQYEFLYEFVSTSPICSTYLAIPGTQVKERHELPLRLAAMVVGVGDAAIG